MIRSVLNTGKPISQNLGNPLSGQGFRDMRYHMLVGEPPHKKFLSSQN
ncbi:MAG: hypothetical protein LBT38_07555 [Deltaproteobacteria bacterium]|jgi:hypothetical protein|nr:hypothetical protein [Deltaproteobacteria bacterium]